MRYTPQVSDGELMARSRAGDADAFAELVARHKPRIERFLFRLCWDEEECRDGAQETFLRLWLARHSYAGNGCLLNYLYVIARNWWLNRVRAATSRPRTIPLEEQLGPTARKVLQSMINSAEAAETTALRNWEVQRARFAVARLPESLRMVFILGHLEGLDYEQVAQIMEIPVGTVKSRMFHAVRRLRSMLEHDEEAVPHEM